MEKETRPPETETDGFARASVIMGAVSLFFSDRLLYPNPDEHFLLSFILPIAGLASAFLGHRRAQEGRTRGRELALAGGATSLVAALILVVAKVVVA